MSQTRRYGLPYILPAQAQKHVTHNEAIKRLDVLLGSSVKTEIDMLPDMADEGDAYLISPSPQADLVNHAHNIAIFLDGTWDFFAPVTGLTIWIENNGSQLVWTGDAWDPLTAMSADSFSFTKLGINAVADTTNRLSLNSQASLFNHDGAGHRLAINKKTAQDTASLLFQTDFSGRAEIGLTGGDRLSLRQSRDGSEWADILSWPVASGLTQFHSRSLNDLPEATSDLSGCLAYVESGLEFAQFAYCDGAVWRRMVNGTILTSQSTLDPNYVGTNAILSNENRDMNSSTPGSWTSARGTKRHTQGRHYFEAELITISSSTSTLIGVCDDSVPVSNLNTFPGNYDKSAAIRPDRIFAKGMTINSPSSNYLGEVGHRICVAVDIDQGWIWFGVNGVWMSTPPDTTSNVTGVNVTVNAGTPLYPVLASAHPLNVVRLHTASTDIAYTVPQGFNVWG